MARIIRCFGVAHFCAASLVLFACAGLTLPRVGFPGLEYGSEAVVDDARRGGQVREDKGQWVPVPIPVSNPTFGSGLQAVLMYLHPQTDPATPNATSGLAAMYTNTESWFAGGFHDGSFQRDRYRLRAFGGYGVFNLDFYGIGGVSGFTLPYRVEGTLGSVQALVRLPKTDNWYAGIQYLYLDSEITFKISEPVSLLPDVTGDARTAALGVLLNYDSRDDNYYPTRGQYAEAKYLDFGDRWGGDFEYSKLIASYNVYLPLADQVTLAARTRVETSDGNTPFFNLAYLDMRGFARGRYLDDSSLSLHAEARYKFRPRWGAIGFYETGWVHDDLSGVTSGTRVSSVGVGVRWQVTRDKNMHLGLDLAFSSDDEAVYIQVGEAF